MKLSVSKTATVDLDPVSEVSATTEEHGRLFNVRGGEEAPRLTRLVNDAVRAHFGMPYEEDFAEGRRAAATAAGKIRPAIFRERNSGLLRVVYKEIAVRFAGKVSAKMRKQILNKFGMTIRRQGQFDRGLYFAHDPKRNIIGQRVVEVANELMMLEEIETASPNFVSEFARRRVPTPNAAQWHLSYRPRTVQQEHSDVGHTPRMGNNDGFAADRDSDP
jgi:hypothetical protein